MRDQHVHSLISHDGHSSMEEYIAFAREKKMEGITFTEHWDDYVGIETKLKTLDIKSYRDAFCAVKEKTDMDIRFGIEIGLQPHLYGKVKAITDEFSFDFIIGSSHITKRLDMAYDPRFFENKTRYEAYMQYFEEMLENILMYDEFDVYGHLDYVARYGGYEEKRIRYEEFSEILDEIFKALIRKDKGIEVNTSGLRGVLGATCPNETLLARYYELGGRIITIGSDAHYAKDLGSYFDETAELLKHIGFREIAVYQNRVPEFVKL